MRSINHKYVIAMIATVCIIVFAPFLFAQNTSDSPNMPASAAPGRSIGEFLTPDGRFDLITTGQPVFRPAAAAKAAARRL